MTSSTVLKFASSRLSCTGVWSSARSADGSLSDVRQAALPRCESLHPANETTSPTATLHVDGSARCRSGAELGRSLKSTTTPT